MTMYHHAAIPLVAVVPATSVILTDLGVEDANTTLREHAIASTALFLRNKAIVVIVQTHTIA